MAEGVEDVENNNNSSSGEQVVMLGAVMPCEMTSPNLGGLKRELEIIPATAATATSPGATMPTHQQHPINLKSEAGTISINNNESDIDRDHDSPGNSPARPMSRCSNSELYTSQMLRGSDRNMTNSALSSPLSSQSHQDQSKNNSAANAVAQAHFNGTMQGMLSLQKLQQNIASMQQQQQQQQQQSSIPSLSGLQGLAGLTAASLNSPLNLSIGNTGLPISGCSSTGLNLNQTQMPQLILASGQLVQGIQGAQLLIPTAQGITTQTILTIPVSQQMNSNEQLAQRLGINGGSVSPNPGLLSPHLLAPSVQQLLNVIQPHLFSAHPPPSTSVSPSGSGLLSTTPQPSQSVHHPRTQTPKSSPPRNASTSSMSSISSSHHHDRLHIYEKPTLSSPSAASTAPSNSLSQSQGTPHYTTNGHSQLSTSPHHLSHSLISRGHSPTSMALNNINRLAATNGEITITKSHGPSPGLGSSSSSTISHTGERSHNLPPQIKLSPTPMHLSPNDSESSRNDLLDDNPNEPTINQTNCNVVDGIDLDEIKEFAKAFKLRRLSLGLTQTQVGQALSVTEGPAYSQSAICSALAAQMYAAQLSSQQQAMFEKLDITPKSAQKIKPVLERWMKEAEESHWHRYKSGQNHLTDFIGVEPSKKRKRRTSFTPQALELLNAHFERNTHPSGTEITGLAHQLGYEREVIRIWFCNKRQALKNTVRMMSKGMV